MLCFISLASLIRDWRFRIRVNTVRPDFTPCPHTCHLTLIARAEATRLVQKCPILSAVETFYAQFGLRSDISRGTTFGFLAVSWHIYDPSSPTLLPEEKGIEGMMPGSVDPQKTQITTDTGKVRYSCTPYYTHKRGSLSILLFASCRALVKII